MVFPRGRFLAQKRCIAGVGFNATPLTRALSCRHICQARSIYVEGGFRAFFVSYPTTVAMNIPVFAVYFASYENFKKVQSFGFRV